MAYRRRYLSGQAATTVVIAEGAITSDKIVDKAVTQPKLDDNAVTSDKIENETILSEDIKAGEVKTSDLGSGAVTTEKIADQAVTVDKLEASIQGIARPLTPGVATAEIADLSVTESKIADSSVAKAKIKPGAVDASKLDVNAVETVKIKDSAVTTAKIAGDAVDQTKIKANAVTGSEILNRSVGTTEIAIDGVQHDNIKDLHVTEPKLNLNSVSTRTIIADAVTEPKLFTSALALRHLESYNIRDLNVHEDFCGNDISNRWRKRIAAGGYIDWVTADPMRGLILNTPATSGQRVVLDWDGKGINLEGNPTDISFWIPGSTLSRVYQKRELGLMYGFAEDSYILFTAEDVAGAVPNWFARCKRAGGETAEDTGVAVTEEVQVLTIEYVSDSEVNFYIDGFLVKTITTNIPTGWALDPWVSVTARTNAVKGFYVQMMDLIMERPAYV